MKKKQATPEPIPVNVVCSLCGEAWSLHREENGEVSTLECIRLLKAARGRIVSIPQPYPVYPTRPWWQQPYVTYTQTSAGSMGTQGYTQTINASDTQPRVLIASAVAK